MSRANPRYRRVNAPLPAVGAANGVVMYRIFGTIEGQLTISVFYYSSAVPAPTLTQLLLLEGNISTQLYLKYRSCLSADWACTQETLDVVHVNNIVGVVSTTNSGTVGVRPAGHLPTEVALVINRKSSVKGQHGRGRVSLPAISTGDVTASKMTLAAAITAVNTLAGGMSPTVTDGTNTYTPCIAQRAISSPKLVVGFSPITSVVPNFLLGTIRRRKIGRGK